MNRPLQVSVIATVYNEGESIRQLLDSLVAQTRQPDEIIICDGGSSDNTVAILHEYADRRPNLRMLIEEGANISRGRNVAIQAARGPIIAVTDAGVYHVPDWLAQLVAPWAENNVESPRAVAGFFLPEVDGVFETAMAATVLPLTADIDPAKFMPSSRSVAFTKAAWEAAGGYPEWLDYCEDLLFDFAINAQEPDQPTAFAWAPDAVAYFRPRRTLAAFWKQYYRYARGDGKADLWRKRYALRYFTYVVLLPALLGHAFWGFFAPWLGWLGLIAGGLVYCWRPWQRVHTLGQVLNPFERLQAMLLVPIIRVVGDVAKMVGYPAGLWWRWQHRTQREIHWREEHA